MEESSDNWTVLKRDGQWEGRVAQCSAFPLIHTRWIFTRRRWDYVRAELLILPDSIRSCVCKTLRFKRTYTPGNVIADRPDTAVRFTAANYVLTITTLRSGTNSGAGQIYTRRISISNYEELNNWIPKRGKFIKKFIKRRGAFFSGPLAPRVPQFWIHFCR